jgi:hypothetical protein
MALSSMFSPEFPEREERNCLLVSTVKWDVLCLRNLTIICPTIRWLPRSHGALGGRAQLQIAIWCLVLRLALINLQLLTLIEHQPPENTSQWFSSAPVISPVRS